jgi:hypothetical protein
MAKHIHIYLNDKKTQDGNAEDIANANALIQNIAQCVSKAKSLQSQVKDYDAKRMIGETISSLEGAAAPIKSFVVFYKQSRVK